MKTQNSQTTHSQLASLALTSASRDNQSVNSDGPSLTDYVFLHDAISIERAINSLLKYRNDSSKLELSDEEWDVGKWNQEMSRLRAETNLFQHLVSESIHESLERIRTHQIDIELQLGHESALHIICILVDLIESAKRDAEVEFKNNNIDYIKIDFLPTDQRRALKRKICSYSGLLRLLPQLYQVREFISLPSILNKAETVELSHFLYLGGCFKKGISIAKIRKDIAQMCGLVASELTLNTIASDNQNKRTPLLLIKKCMKNWDIEQEKIERVKTERERLKKKKISESD